MGQPTPDTLDDLAGLTSTSPVFITRHARNKVVTATQACEDLIFSDSISASLSSTERYLLASEQARISGVPALANYYLQRAHTRPANDQTAAAALFHAVQHAGSETGIPRLDTILHFVRTLALDPTASDRDTLLAIPTHGLSVDDTVLLAQLIGFVAYQARVLVGLQAMAELGGQEQSVEQEQESTPFVHPAKLPAPGEALRRNGFTSETLGWDSWLPVLDPETASAEQQRVLDISHPKARSMDFYLLLCRQPEVLLERSQAFNAIMYAPGGLSRAERELAAAAVSRVNRCVFCLAVHAQRFEQLAKRNDVMAQLFDDPDSAGTNARERAIIQASVALTRTPGQFGAEAIQALRTAGLSDTEILDTVHAAALFGWANRLMLNLGKETYPTQA